MAVGGAETVGSGPCHELLHQVQRARRKWRIAAVVGTAWSALITVLVVLLAAVAAAGWSDALAGMLQWCVAVSICAALTTVVLNLWKERQPGLSMASWAAQRVAATGWAERLCTAVELAAASCGVGEQGDGVSEDGRSSGSPILIDATVRAAWPALEELDAAVDRRHVRNSRFALGVLSLVALHLVILQTSPLPWQTLSVANDEIADQGPRLVGTLVSDLRMKVVAPDYVGTEPGVFFEQSPMVAVLRGSTVRFEAMPIWPDRVLGVELSKTLTADDPVAAAATPNLNLQHVGLQFADDGLSHWQAVVRQGLLYRYVGRDREGRQFRERQWRRLTVSADRPPEVRIVIPDRQVEVRAGQSVVIEGAADDDYGLTSMEMVVAMPSGRVERRSGTLIKGERHVEMRESVEVDLLGLRPDEFALVQFEAQDNNAVDGPRRVVSRRLRLRMFSAPRHHARTLDFLGEVALEWTMRLADRLERDPNSYHWSLRHALDNRTDLNEAEQRSFKELKRLRQQLGNDVLSRASSNDDLEEIERMLRNRIAEETRRLHRIDPFAKGAEAARFLFDLQRLHRRVIGSQERAVLLISGVAVAEHRDALVRDGRGLRRLEARLGEVLKALAEKPDDVRRLQAERLLDEVESLVERMMQSAAKQARIVPYEHINAEASLPSGLHSDMRQHRSALRSVRKQLREGDHEAAMARLKGLQGDMERWIGELEERAQRQRGREDAGLAQLIKHVSAGINTARKGQAEVRESLRPYSEAQARESAGHLQRNLEQVESQVMLHLRRAREQVRPGHITTPRMRSNRALARSRASLSDAEVSVQSGRVDLAIQSLTEAEERVAAARQGLVRLVVDSEVGVELRVADLSSLATAAVHIGKASTLLREALPQAGSLHGSRVKNRLVAVGQQQDRLQRSLRKVARRLAREGAGHPALQSHVGSRLGHALQMMHQSGQSLRDWDATRSFEQMAETISALDQAGQLLEERSRSASRGSGGIDTSGFSPTTRAVVLRSGNADDRGEDYRQRVLEAMRSKAPGGYLDRLKRYYQEIIK